MNGYSVSSRKMMPTTFPAHMNGPSLGTDTYNVYTFLAQFLDIRDLTTTEQSQFKQAITDIVEKIAVSLNENLFLLTECLGWIFLLKGGHTDSVKKEFERAVTHSTAALRLRDRLHQQQAPLDRQQVRDRLLHLLRQIIALVEEKLPPTILPSCLNRDLQASLSILQEASPLSLEHQALHAVMEARATHFESDESFCNLYLTYSHETAEKFWNAYTFPRRTLCDILTLKIEAHAAMPLT